MNSPNKKDQNITGNNSQTTKATTKIIYPNVSSRQQHSQSQQPLTKSSMYKHAMFGSSSPPQHNLSPTKYPGQVIIRSSPSTTSKFPKTLDYDTPAPSSCHYPTTTGVMADGPTQFGTLIYDRRYDQQPDYRSFAFKSYFILMLLFPLMMLPAYMQFLREFETASYLSGMAGGIGVICLVVSIGSYVVMNKYPKQHDLASWFYVHFGVVFLGEVISAIAYGLSWVPRDVFACVAQSFIALAVMTILRLVVVVSCWCRASQTDGKSAEIIASCLAFAIVGVGPTYSLLAFQDLETWLAIVSGLGCIIICFWFGYRAHLAITKYATSLTDSKSRSVGLCFFEILASILLLHLLPFTKSFINSVTLSPTSKTEND